jgi:2-polyprenyl-6-methoxyphenol hydroxylase-like FAD-dependent oxidoreductase
MLDPVSRLVVIGAGVGGLATAFVASDAGHDVTIVEQDDLELPRDAADAFAGWQRRGVPQLRHSHAFPPRILAVLRARTPALLDALLAAGAQEISLVDRLPPEMVGFEPEPGDEDLAGLACRRTTFELALRRAVGARPIALARGSADGLVADRDRSGRIAVRGVRVRDAEGATSAVVGDLVVDASGSRSALPRWLADAGLPAPQERVSPTGGVYATRFHRWRDGSVPTPIRSPLMVDAGPVICGVYPGDDRTFSATIVVPTGDPALRALLRDPAFEAVAPALPVLRDWVDPERAEPISSVHVMAAISNRVRRIVQPGLVALGDAAVRSNPLYGAGCTLALVQALELVDLLGRAPDPEALVVAFDRHLRADIDPWHDDAVARDQARIRARTEPSTPAHRFQREGIALAMRVDPHVWRAALRVRNLLDPPDAMQDPDILQRVLRAWATHGSKVDEQPLPTRDELLALASARA